MKKIIKLMILSSLSLAFAFTMLIPKKVSAAALSVEEKKIIKDVRGRIEAPIEDDDPNWVYEDIVGWQFTPDKSLLNKLNNVDEFVYDENFSFHNDKSKTKLTEKEFNASLYIIGIYSVEKDESYKLFAVHDGSAMYVKTPDDQYVEILVPPVSNHEQLPDVSTGDYDGDGEYELAIIPHVLHGTGYYEDSFIMVDKSENDTWFAYHLSKELYIDYFNKHITTSYKNKKLSMKLDGVEVGKSVTVAEESDYYFNSLTNISMNGDTVLVSTVPLVYSTKIGHGIGEFSDYKIWLSIEYKGCGEFNIYDSMYQLYAKKLYQKQIENISSDKFYGFLEGPSFETPIMLVSNSVYEQMSAVDEDLVNYGRAHLTCEVYLMVNNKCKKIGELDPGTSLYTIKYIGKDIIVHERHGVKTYYVEGDKLVFNNGIQDNVVATFDEKYEGYGFYDGKKFKKLSETAYYKYCREFEKGHEIYLTRGSK